MLPHCRDSANPFVTHHGSSIVAQLQTTCPKHTTNIQVRWGTHKLTGSIWPCRKAAVSPLALGLGTVIQGVGRKTVVRGFGNSPLDAVGNYRAENTNSYYVYLAADIVVWE